MFKIIITVAAMTLLLLADAPVLQTGQTLSYDADGNIVPYGSIKDDGYYRAGKARSYSHSGDIVIDNATGLHWQDNESIQKKWKEDGSYPAAYYCNDLVLYYNNTYYYDWRLPSIKELLTLPDASQYNPGVTEGIFNYIQSSYYWSITTVLYMNSDAWYVYFNYGNSYHNVKTVNYYVRCVRGGQLEPSNLSRSDEIVTDSTTGLQWQDDSATGTTYENWIGAINYCENTLSLGGYTDWRMPNKNELLSIVDYARYNPAIDDTVFINVSSSDYWSSTTTVSGTSSARYVNFKNGRTTSNSFKSDSNYVRCVRGGQVNRSAFLPSIIIYLLN